MIQGARSRRDPIEAVVLMEDEHHEHLVVEHEAVTVPAANLELRLEGAAGRKILQGVHLRLGMTLAPLAENPSSSGERRGIGDLRKACC